MMCFSLGFRVINSAPDNYTGCESLPYIMLKARSQRHTSPFQQNISVSKMVTKLFLSTSVENTF